jgi:CRISPR/Cas system-associated exonuclease Cas4 (RecB family)
MLNEFTYCPRLFFYEHVEGVFAHNLETVEGAIRHSRVDAAVEEFPEPDTIVDNSARIKARGLMLSSDEHQLIAKMDLVESTDGVVVPVDYKRGKPREYGVTRITGEWLSMRPRRRLLCGNEAASACGNYR